MPTRKETFKKAMFVSILAGIFISLLMLLPANAEILFEDNFDSHPDWTVTQPQSPTPDDSAWQGEANIPDGYHAYYNSNSYYTNIGNNTLNINGDQPRGGTGKSFLLWNESDTRGSSGSGWSSDGQLTVSLPTGYDEIYIRVFVRFQPGWKWSTVPDVLQKFFRATHYHGDSPFQYFSGGNQHPLANFNINRFNTSGNPVFMADYRYENTYYPDQATPAHARSEPFSVPIEYTTWTDGPTNSIWTDEGWHCWEFRFKMNSAVGVADGEYEMWFDDVQYILVDDLAWSDNGSQASPRLNWNYVLLGGNNFNHFSPNIDESEQWYAMDDVVISTDRITSSYVIGGNPTVSIPPTSPTTNATTVITGSITAIDGTTITGATCTGGHTVTVGSPTGLVHPFSVTVPLVLGENTFTIEATDSATNTGSAPITIVRNAVPAAGVTTMSLSGSVTGMSLTGPVTTMQ